MFNVGRYWDRRYRGGGTSGVGSEDEAAQLKTAYINDLIKTHGVRSIVDWGFGDGIVAAGFEVTEYTGLEISLVALRVAREAIEYRPRWSWILYDGYYPPPIHGDLALSLDVIFHLVEDAMYERHMANVFASAPLVCIASSNRDEEGAPHVRHRRFTNDLPRGWDVVEKPPAAQEGDIGMWVFEQIRRPRREGRR
jgi:hypothetical protein